MQKYRTPYVQHGIQFVAAIITDSLIQKTWACLAALQKDAAVDPLLRKYRVFAEGPAKQATNVKSPL